MSAINWIAWEMNESCVNIYAPYIVISRWYCDTTVFCAIWTKCPFPHRQRKSQIVWKGLSTQQPKDRPKQTNDHHRDDLGQIAIIYTHTLPGNPRPWWQFIPLAKHVLGQSVYFLIKELRSVFAIVDGFKIWAPKRKMKQNSSSP